MPVIERDLRDVTYVTFLYPFFHGIILAWQIKMDHIHCSHLKALVPFFPMPPSLCKSIAPSLSYDSPNFAQNHALKLGTFSAIVGVIFKFLHHKRHPRVDLVVPTPGGVLSGHFGTRFKKLGSGIIIYGSQNH